MSDDILAALAAERLNNRWWTTRPNVRADNERRRQVTEVADQLTARRRLAACVAEANELEHDGDWRTVAEADGTPDPRRATA